MTVYRPTAQKSERDEDIPAPVPWRHSRTPSVGSVPNTQASGSGTRSSSSFVQVVLIAFLVAYICLPSYAVRHISSKTSLQSVSNTGRSVLYSLSEIIKSLSSNVSGTGGVAIVAACMNRHETLAKVLPTWLSVEGVREIVIVDWGSEPSLRPIVKPENDPRVKLYRVNSEESWVLSRAYNLALNKSTRDYVIRTDCDYALDAAILEAHNLTETETGFYSGNWMLARDENEVHLNGAMVMKRDVFWSVGGYDERIQTYGWDDEDLYIRLRGSNIAKLNVSYDHVSHVSHGDGSRAQSGVKFAQVQIDLNQLLLENLPQWSKNLLYSGESSTYKVVREENDGYVELKAEHVPASLRNRVDAAVYEKSWAMALGRRLADDYHVPWDILEAMDSENKELMLRSLMTLQNDLDVEIEKRSKNGQSSAKKEHPPRHARLLLVHCMHGLGNRLRALGSALAFAKNSQRVPLIIWESDAHIAAEFDSLFNTSNYILLKRFTPVWPFTDLPKYDPSWNHFDFYNYMEMEEGANKGELIVNNREKHLYYKGAYVMEAPQYTWWETDNEQLKALEPVRVVQDNLKKLEQQGLSDAIGVHIRNRTLAADIKDVDFEKEYGSEAAATMEHWRTQSSYRTFISEIERIIADEDSKAKFYIATDTFEVISLMEETFPGRILSTKRSCDDRDSECVKYAVIDMYALSRAKQLLGSNWSSYTEMAERLGGLKARLAGQDFGRNPPPRERVVLQAEDVAKSRHELEAEERDKQIDSSRE